MTDHDDQSTNNKVDYNEAPGSHGSLVQKETPDTAIGGGGNEGTAASTGKGFRARVQQLRQFLTPSWQKSRHEQAQLTGVRAELASLTGDTLEKTETEVERQERSQATIELFADKAVEESSDNQEKLLTHSAALSRIEDWDNLPPDIPEELVALINANKNAYKDFVGNISDDDRAAIDAIVGNIRTYKETFQFVITDLKAKIGARTRVELSDVPGFLNSGSNGSAFRIEVDGKVYAAKFSQGRSGSNYEIKALRQAKGIPHTSQISAYSFEDGVVIMEMLPGTTVSKFTPENAPEYSDEHIIQLIETVKELDARGIKIDPKPSNFLYDPEHGFSVVDFDLKTDSSKDYKQEIFGWMSAILSSRKFEKIDYEKPDSREKHEEQVREKLKISLSMTTRLLGVVQDRYPDIVTVLKTQNDEMIRNGDAGLFPRNSIPQHQDLESYLAPYYQKLTEIGL